MPNIKGKTISKAEHEKRMDADEAKYYAKMAKGTKLPKHISELLKLQEERNSGFLEEFKKGGQFKGKPRKEGIGIQGLPLLRWYSTPPQSDGKKYNSLPNELYDFYYHAFVNDSFVKQPKQKAA